MNTTIPPKPLTVLVEGNICSGKSSLLNSLQKSDIFQVLPEPLSKWQNFQNMNLFDLQYKDPKKYFLSFELYVMQTLLEVQNTPCNRPVRLMERSLFSARDIFIPAALRQRTIDHTTYQALDSIFNFMQEKFPLHVDLIIYVRSTPEEIYERVQQRGRIEERQIDINYIRLLHNLYDQWINRLSIPVVYVDSDLPPMEMEMEYKKCKNTILRLLFENTPNISSSSSPSQLKE